MVAAFHPRPSLSLRLLTSRSPALPLGLWLVLGGGGGAALSALATALALRQSSPLAGPVPGPRSTRRPAAESESWEGGEWQADPSPRSRRWAPAQDPVARVVAPERAPGEPPPTVSVPFRVIRRPGSRPASPDAAPVGGSADDWDESPRDDW